MVAQLLQPVGSAKNTKRTENMTFEGYAQKIIEITSMVKCMINIYHWDNKFKHFIGNHCHAVTLVSLVFM